MSLLGGQVDDCSDGLVLDVKEVEACPAAHWGTHYAQGEGESGGFEFAYEAARQAPA